MVRASNPRRRKALIDAGADVLTMHQNSPAVVQVAEQNGRYAIGYHSDMSLFAPTMALTSAAWDWAPIYAKAVTDLHEGKWRPDQRWWGIDEGAVKLAPLAKSLPEELVGRVEQARVDMVEGRLRLFEGPIRDQSGAIAVPSGKLLSDAELLNLDYFVLGVDGELPEPQAPGGDDN